MASAATKVLSDCKHFLKKPTIKRTISTVPVASPSKPVIEKTEEEESKPKGMTGQCFHYGKYTMEIGERLGSGSYGEVYEGSWKGREVAVKVEKEKTNQLLGEYQLYDSLKSSRRARGLSASQGPFLKVYGLFHFAFDLHTWNAMIFDKAGCAIESLLSDGSPFCKGLDELSVLCVTAQMIDALRSVHELGMLHRDITPRNILIARVSRSSPVMTVPKHDGYDRWRRLFMSGSDRTFLIDFGLAKEIPDIDTVDRAKELRRSRAGNSVVGTPRYCSKRAHCKRTLLERDDLLSLVYTMVFMYKTTLPWASRYRSPDRNKLIGEHKYRVKMRDLCKGLPRSFVSFAEHADSIQWSDKPRYNTHISAMNTEIAHMSALLDQIHDDEPEPKKSESRVTTVLTSDGRLTYRKSPDLTVSSDSSALITSKSAVGTGVAGSSSSRSPKARLSHAVCIWNRPISYVIPELARELIMEKSSPLVSSKQPTSIVEVPRKTTAVAGVMDPSSLAKRKVYHQSSVPVEETALPDIAGMAIDGELPSPAKKRRFCR